MVTLSPELIEEVKQVINTFGGKISSLVETLLKDFLENAKLRPQELIITKKDHIQQLELMKTKIENQIQKLKEGDKT